MVTGVTGTNTAALQQAAATAPASSSSFEDALNAMTPQAKQFLEESETSQIFSMTQNFASQLPGAVSGGNLVGELQSKALQGPSDPTDPGKDALEPDQS